MKRVDSQNRKLPMGLGRYRGHVESRTDSMRVKGVFGRKVHLSQHSMSKPEIRSERRAP